MKKIKFVIIIIFLFIASFLFSACKKRIRFPSDLDEIGFQSVYDSVILNKYKVTDKDLIKEFSKMLNKCELRSLTNEEKGNAKNNPNEVYPFLNGVRIVMDDLIFYLNEDGFYSNTKNEEDIFVLDGFNKELFNKVFESREKSSPSIVEAEFPEGLEKLYCKRGIDSYQSIVTDKTIVDDFLKMLQGCKIRVLTEDEIKKVQDRTISFAYSHVFRTGSDIEDGLEFEINENGYLKESYSFAPEDIYYLEGFNIDVYNRFISAKEPLYW